jgi:hypothetical protein
MLRTVESLLALPAYRARRRAIHTSPRTVSSYVFMKNHAPLCRVTVTLPRPLADKLAHLRDTHRVSVSSIVELAVAAYVAQNTDDPRRNGATLRRSRTRELRATAAAAD